MNQSKPKLFITPNVVNFLKFTEEYVNPLRGRFDVRTASEPVVTRAEFLVLCEGQDAILGSGMDVIDEEVVKAAGGSLKVVCLTSAGYDRLNTNAMKVHCIRVGLTGGAITNATAELAVTLLLCASRKLFSASRQYTSDPSVFFEQTPAEGLEDSTVGIIGAGRIGQSVARKLIPFEIKRLLYYSRTEKDEMKKLGGQLCSLEDIARKSDYIILSLAYNAETDKIIHENLLTLMKADAMIINVGRGGLIDQDALVDALQKKEIGFAALDVTVPEPLPPEHPLMHLENTLLSPHIGGCTESAFRKVRQMAVRNITAFFDNEPMPEELTL